MKRERQIATGEVEQWDTRVNRPPRLSPHSEASQTLQEFIDVDRVLQITRHQPLVGTGFTVCAIAALIYVEDGTLPDWIYLLSLPIFLVSLLSILVWFFYHDRPRPKRINQKSIRMLSGVISLYGLMWGIFLSVLAIHAAQPSHIWLLLIAIGIASACNTFAFYLPTASIVFGILCILPVLGVSAYLEPDLLWILLLLGIGYFMTTISAVLNSYRSFTTGQTLAYENVQLLEQSQIANKAKDDFIKSMNHEFRTPLNAILGFAQLGRLEHPENIKLTRYFDGIITATGILVSQADRILNAAELDHGAKQLQPEQLSPSDIFKELLPVVREMAAKKRLEFQGGKESSCIVTVDREALRQILMNFISNSIKYTPTGGSFEFGCYNLDEITLRLYVTDTGIGIPEEDKPAIFSQFSRASNAKNYEKGTGLGLFYCKALAERMGGKIGFESVEGEGSTFYLDLPASASSLTDP